MKITSIIAVTALLLGSTTFAGAQQQPSNSSTSAGAMSSPNAAGGNMASANGGMTACRADAAKYCSGKTGADRSSCLNTNMTSLSNACKTAMNGPAPSR